MEGNAIDAQQGQGIFCSPKSTRWSKGTAIRHSASGGVGRAYADCFLIGVQLCTNAKDDNA